MTVYYASRDTENQYFRGVLYCHWIIVKIIPKILDK